MYKKISVLFLLLLVMASPALAVITTTVSAPVSGTTYNNLAANIRSVPITFSIIDTNSGEGTKSDVNVSIKWYSVGTLPENGTAIISDANLIDYNLSHNSTSTFYCDIASDIDATGTCTYNWTLPGNLEAPEGTYYIDVNVTEWYLAGNETLNDGNGTTTFVINNRMSTAGSTKDLMALVGMVLAALVLLGGLASVLVLKTDIANTAIVTIVAAVAVGIAAMVIGTILLPL